jgi:phenylpropionate dioxygenase-like ring-hydroxylating dioxygenase large terminal subunit
MENAFDNSHFSFVHKNTFGQFQQPKPSKYHLWETDWGFESETIVPVRNIPKSYRITGTTEPTTIRHLRNKWYMPFVRRFDATYPSGLRHIIFNCITPIDDSHSMVVQWLYRNDTEANVTVDELLAWDREITIEDRHILEGTDYDTCVDTSRRVEFHMDSDKPGLLMRNKLLRLLREHGENEAHL